MAHLFRDAAFGVRLLRRNPASTVIAVLTLALGIAATTSIFSVIYATYLAPLPYRDADRLVMLWSHFEGRRNSVSAADFLDWKRQATAFEDLNAWNSEDVTLSADERPERIRAGPATPGFLSMLGGHPLALGRTFVPEEGTVGREEVVILTHRLWQQRFAGDAAIVGRPVRIDPRPYTVVGVLGPGPADEDMNRLWLPLAFTTQQLAHRDWRWWLVMGRLKPGSRSRAGQRGNGDRDCCPGGGLSGVECWLDRERRALPEQLRQQRHEDGSLAAAGSGGLRTTHRLHECCQPATRARHGAATRVGPPRLARRITRGHPAPVPHRECGAGTRRRRPRNPSGPLDGRSHRGAAAAVHIAPRGGRPARTCQFSCSPSPPASSRPCFSASRQRGVRRAPN